MTGPVALSLAIALLCQQAFAPIPPKPQSGSAERPQREWHIHRGLRFPAFLPNCTPCLPGSFPCLFPPYYVAERFSSFEFFGPPVGIWPPGPVGFGGFVPFYIWQEPIIMVPVASAAQVIDLRDQPQRVQPALPRGTTDIPERLVEQLIGSRRPTLAQRAQAIRLQTGGDRLFQTGHFDRAIERYQQALAQTPDNDEAKFRLGAALVAAGKYDEAGRTLRDALHHRPDWPTVAHDLRQLFPDDEAVRGVLEKLVRESLRPSADSDVQFLRAYVLYFTGQWAEAEAIFRDPPPGVAVEPFNLFVEALDRQRGVK